MLYNARIAVVVPAYNESRHIAGMLACIPAFVDDVLVVDDGSQDDTFAIARRAADARTHVVRHPQNLGVGAAIKTGYREAFERGADAVAVMAGDGQMDPEDLLALLEPVLVGEADYAKGDRLSHPEAYRRMPLARFVGNHVLSWLTRKCTGTHVRDSQCGYTVLSRRAHHALPVSELWTGYGYPNDLIAWLAQLQLPIRDIIVRPIYGDEESGIRLRHALLVIPLLLLRALLRRLGLWGGPVRSLGEVASSREAP